MLVRFHGVRGSNPTCDVRTWNYGGNTPCVEVETPVGHRIIIDGGTGLRSLSHAPGWGPDSVPVQASWLVSHYHWDHIQGLPFFAPLYEARNRFDLYGLKPDGGGGMEAALQGQMLRPYFPVDMSLLAAARAFTVVDPGCRWQIEDATVEAVPLHHPQGCLGFRIETASGVVAYATDNEPGDSEGDDAVRYLARDADLLIYDAQYSPAMLRHRQGWGHSSWLEGVAVAKSAGARSLVLFHHDPDSDDAVIGRFVQMAREQWPETCAAAEGLQATVRTPTVAFENTSPRVGPRVTTRLPVRVRGRRSDGSPMDAEGFLVNLTLTGTYVVVPDTPELSSEVEVTLLESDQLTAAMPGHVVRVDTDPETGLPGVGIVFRVEDEIRRLAAKR
jgi:phosphoribosyl 1,2-cyclic phosphodiesterase